MTMFAADGDTTDNMYVSETKLVHLELYFAANVSLGTEVNIRTPAVEPHIIEIVSASVIYVGDNLPCVMKEEISPLLSGITYVLLFIYMLMTMNTGVPHFQIYPADKPPPRALVQIMATQMTSLQHLHTQAPVHPINPYNHTYIKFLPGQNKTISHSIQTKQLALYSLQTLHNIRK